MLASKCLKGKPTTVSKSAEACMLFIELEQQDAVVESVLKAFSDKVPKVVLAAVDILLQAVRCARRWALAPACMYCQCVHACTRGAGLCIALMLCAGGRTACARIGLWLPCCGAMGTALQRVNGCCRCRRLPGRSSFGAKAVDAKAIMKALPALFGHTQAGVRDKAKETAVELCAYLGQGMVAGVLLDKMPAAMRKDVDAAIAELPPGKKQPVRFTRKEAAERAAREAELAPMDVDGGGEVGGGEGGEAAAEEEPVRTPSG